MAEIHEPYRTGLLVHSYIRLGRDKVFASLLSDLELDSEGVRLQAKDIDRACWSHLHKYLRTYLTRVESVYLFPLPSNPSKHLNAEYAHQLMGRILHGDRPHPEPTP